MINNSGRLGKRSTDGRGILTHADKFNQSAYAIPQVESFAVTDGSYNPYDDTAADTAGGQTIVVYGSGFRAGATVMVGTTTIAVVTVLGNDRLTFTSPALASGSYTIYVTNSNGGTGILVPGLVYSGLPTWSTTAGSIGSYYETTAISNTLTATGDAPITYSLYSGSLPTGATLFGNGVITGTAPVDSASTTYSFTVQATDAQKQDSYRSFSITVNTDVVTWTSPASNVAYSLEQGLVMSNVSLSASSAAGYAVSYAANTLPTGVSLTSGTIYGTPTVLATNVSLITATAASTNRSAVRVITWTVNLAGDQYIKYTPLLLSANAAIETTSFVADASLNNAQLTVVGDTRVQAFNPYQVGYYSILFDGSTRLATSSSSVGISGTGNFTVECWFYLTAAQATYHLTDSATSNFLFLKMNASNICIGRSQVAEDTTITYSFSQGRWYHVAFSRVGSTVYGFVNGIQQVSATNSNSYAVGTFNIGQNSAGTQGWPGYISNLRYSTTAFYTAAFTPSTTPLLPTVDTVILVGQSNRIVDSSINSYALTTATGTPKINTATPFTTVYQASTQYYSGYFNGSTDYLTVPSSAVFQFGTGDFTVECWVYKSAAANGPIVDARGSATAVPWAFYVDASNFPYFYDGTSYTSTVAIVNSQWNHIAAVRTSGTLKIFVNGVQGYSNTVTTALNPAATVYIGAQTWTPVYTSGYISNLRITKGLAVYTGNFVPPTAPLAATQSAGTNIAAITQPSYSVYFNGSSQYLSVPDNAALQLATATPFTIEAWVYPTNLSATDHGIIGKRAAGNEWQFNIHPSYGYLNFWNGATTYQSNTTLVVNTWYHVAVSWDSTTLRFFVNGVSGSTYTGFTVSSSTNQVIIGGTGPAASGLFTGYISNLRVVKGQALFTANFTPSTSPLTTTSQGATAANVSLLTCQSTTIIDNSLNQWSITNTGTATVASPNPFATGTVALLTTQSPTFVDNSYNNFTITAATTSVKPLAQSPFTPVYYSNYFNGNGDYLVTPSSAAFGFGTGDFTVEFWARTILASKSGYMQAIYDSRANGNTLDAKVIVYLDASNVLTYANGGNTLITGLTLTANRWYHIAVVRISGTSKLYADGVQTGSSAADAYNLATSDAVIGTVGDARGTYNGYFSGYISNLRVVKGQGLYTTTFTPSTSPLTTTSQGITTGTVSLLTCQSPYFIDTSTNSFAITATGSPKIAGVAPFTQPTGYTTTAVTTYGSGYFDGTGDYLTLADSPNLEPGSSNFTIEMWVYPTGSNATNGSVIFSKSNTSSYGPINVGFAVPANSNYLQALSSTNGSTWGIQSVSTKSFASMAYSWNHVAYVRNGSAFTLYLNGVSVATATSASALVDNTNSVMIGYVNYASTEFPGYITDVRYVVGTALYTSNFVPTFTTPLTAVTNTQLLTLQTSGSHNNSVFTDASGFNNVITRNGNTTNGTFSPYGNNWSTYVNNNGSWLSVSSALMTSSNLANFGTGNFTIEAWAYPTAIGTGTASFTIFHIWDNNAGSGRFGLGLASTGAGLDTQSGLALGAGTQINAVSMTVGVWYHVAVTRNASTFDVWVNGVRNYTYTSSASFTPYTYQLTIGGYINNYTSGTGYISNLRFVNGTALYTTAFTPPTAPLTAITGITLLTLQNNRWIDNSTNNVTIAVTGTPQVQKFSPFATVTLPTYYSGYFSTTGQYLSVATNAALNVGSGDFTLEAWIYGTSYSTYNKDIFVQGTSGMALYVDYTNSKPTLGIYGGSTVIAAVSTVAVNTWYHVAVSRSGTTVKLFINGAVDATATSSTNISSAVANTIGGDSSYANGSFSGYISNLRLTKGQALYTAAFTPSTTPLTTTSQGATAANVSLLTCQNNTFIDNSLNYFAITSTGSPQILAVSPFTPTASAATSYTPATFGGSMYFDGTGDYLSVPYSTIFDWSTSTMELWVYPLSFTNYNGLLTKTDNSSANDWELVLNSSGNVIFRYWNGGAVSVTSTNTIKLNTWTHLAFSSNGTTGTLYINGVNNGTVSVTTPSATANLPLRIGQTSNGITGGSTIIYFNGYMCDVKYTPKIALYTANFYPGATPATPTYTIGTTNYASALLLNGTTGGVIDAHRNVDLETVGDAKVTPFSPYNGSYYSNLFNGSSDYLSVPGNAALNIGTGSFTVECWFYTSTPSTIKTIFNIADSGSTGYGAVRVQTIDTSPYRLWWLMGNGSGWQVNVSVGDFTGSTWNHLAITRNGTSVYFFLNGTQVGTTQTNSTSLNAGGTTYVGFNSGTAYYWNGYVSNLRCINGTALYTSNFTPSTTPLTAVAGTALLTCQSNKFIDNSTNAFTVTAGGTPKVQTQNPFQVNTGVSYYFDGTGDYLIAPSTQFQNFNFNTGDFTIECWLYQITFSGDTAWMASYGTWATSVNFYCGTRAGTPNILLFRAGDSIPITLNGNTGIIANIWTHIAITRASGVTRMFVGGVLQTSTHTGSVNIGATVMPLGIGAANNGTEPLNGYISDLRITKGYARYTTAFTPPTSPVSLK